MTTISTLIFGDPRLEEAVLKALGNPEVMFDSPWKRAREPRLHLLVVTETLNGPYFVDGEFFFSKTVVLHKLEPRNSVFPSGQILSGGWFPTGETLELEL